MKYFVILSLKYRKEYLPNLPVSILWDQIFVFLVRDLIFWLLAFFAELCKVSGRLDNIDIRHFIRVPPFMFFDFAIYQKFKGGTFIKCLISMLSNLTVTLHSQRKSKNKQVATI